MQDFIKTIYPDTKEGYILVWQKSSKKSLFFKTADEAENHISAMQDKNDLYIGCGLRDKIYDSYQRGGIKQVYAIPGFWLDVDIYDEKAHGKSNLPKTIEQAIAIIGDMTCEPSVLINSGHGLQAWWLFEKLWVLKNDEERLAAKKYSEAWNKIAQQKAIRYGYDVDMTHDLARVLRMPGTVNAKVEGRHVAVKLIKNTGHRYSIIDIKEKCIDLLALNSTTETKTTISSVDFKINTEAAPPFDKFTGLCKRNIKFKKSCERNRKDFADQSPSAYDFSMARYMAEDNWSDQEIVDTLIAMRRQNNEGLKETRADYFARTINKVRSSIAKKIEESFETEIDTKTTEEKIGIINERLGVSINRIIKYISDPPLYSLEMTDGKSIRLGDVGNLITQRLFAKHIAAVAGIYVTPKKPAVWDVIAQLLLDVCEEIEIGDEATELGNMQVKVTEYLEVQKVYSDVKSAVTMRKPFYDKVGGEEFIFFSGKEFRNWAHSATDDKVTPQQMGISFRHLGFTQIVHRIEDKTYKLWRIPKMSPLYIEEKTQNEKYFLS